MLIPGLDEISELSEESLVAPILALNDEQLHDISQLDEAIHTSHM
jgi:hypothetical protein